MKSLKIFALMLFAATFAACSDDEGSELVNDGVSVVSTNATFLATGGQGSVTVDKSVSKAYANVDWLTLSTSGNTVSMNAVANDNKESRSAKLVIKASETDSVIVGVTQYGYIFNVGTKGDLTANFDERSQSLYVNVSCSEPVTITYCAPWVKATPDAEGISLEVEANGYLSRTDSLKFMGGVYEKKMFFTQSPTLMEISPDGETIVVPVTDTDLLNVLDKPEWMTINVKDNALEIVVEGNYGTKRRSGIVRVGTNEKEEYMNVTQNWDDPWKSLGKAIYVEDIVAGLFELDNVAYYVEVQEYKPTPGLYRLVNPYGAAFPYNEDGDWDTSKDYYMEINCCDPEGCYIDEQELGFDWGYGMFSVYSMAANYLDSGYPLSLVKTVGVCGTLEDGVITFPEKALLVSMANYNNGALFYANTNSAFTVYLPEAVAKMAPAKKAMAKSKAPASKKTLKPTEPAVLK